MKMNYDERYKLQQKLKQFSDKELSELKDFVIEKEITERQDRKDKATLFLYYQ
jgi:hypothetical protein